MVSIFVITIKSFLIVKSFFNYILSIMQLQLS